MFTAVRTSDDDRPADPVPMHRGARAGRWRIEHELGRGGMGAVYAVTHEDIGKRAALKVVHPRAKQWWSDDRFLDEARVVNRIAHPGIVDIFETGVSADGRPYLVMERLDGQTLGQRVAAGRVLADEACAILLEVCGPLAAAHAAQIVHCDLKLDNIFLLDGGTADAPRAKILDWGIAKELAGAPRNDVFVGTPIYVSPEQARGLPLTTRSDIYSLGVIAYELFLEGAPFTAESAAEVLGMHVCEAPPPPRELWPDIPVELERLLAAMLAKEPEARPSIEEVATALATVRAALAARRVEWTTPEVALPVPAPAVSWVAARWRGFAAAAAVAVLALCARAVIGTSTADAADDRTHATASAPRAVLAVPALPAVPASIDTPPPPIAAPPVVAVAAKPIAPAAPAITTTTPPAHPAAARGHAGRPRRVAVLDPDGTIEPYR